MYSITAIALRTLGVGLVVAGITIAGLVWWQGGDICYLGRQAAHNSARIDRINARVDEIYAELQALRLEAEEVKKRIDDNIRKYEKKLITKGKSHE